MADFCLISRRALDQFEHRIFRAHFLLGADWKLCCRQLGVDRPTFFSTVYRIEEKLGRRFAEVRPYPLYPLDEYFTGTAPNPQDGTSWDLASKLQPMKLPLSA
jgi:hypothetical protein